MKIKQPRERRYKKVDGGGHSYYVSEDASDQHGAGFQGAGNGLADEGEALIRKLSGLVMKRVLEVGLEQALVDGVTIPLDGATVQTIKNLRDRCASATSA